MTTPVNAPEVQREWIGTYEPGSPRPSATLTISKMDGLTYHRVHDVLGASWKKVFPIVRTTRDRITIDLGGEDTSGPNLCTTYVLVPWGSRMYLLSEAVVPAFCYYANERGGWTAYDSPFPLRRSLTEFTEKGSKPLPIVPPEFEKYLLRDVVETVVVEATVLEPTTDGLVKARVVVAAGGDRGLLAGMSLFFVELENWGKGELIDVRDSTSTAEFTTRRGLDDREKPIVAGAKLSTTRPSKK